jgi:hypothetical protein
MVAHAFNPSTQEAEAGESLSSSQSYTEKPCLRKQTNKQNIKQTKNPTKQKKHS